MNIPAIKGTLFLIDKDSGRILKETKTDNLQATAEQNLKNFNDGTIRVYKTGWSQDTVDTVMSAANLSFAYKI